MALKSMSTSSSSLLPLVLGSSRVLDLVLGLPMNPVVNVEAEAAAVVGMAKDEETKWQVLSTSQELFKEARSVGSRMLVKVMTLLMISSRLLTRVVEALKKVVK